MRCDINTAELSKLVLKNKVIGNDVNADNTTNVPNWTKRQSVTIRTSKHKYFHFFWYNPKSPKARKGIKKIVVLKNWISRIES